MGWFIRSHGAETNTYRCNGNSLLPPEEGWICTEDCIPPTPTPSVRYIFKYDEVSYAGGEQRFSGQILSAGTVGHVVAFDDDGFIRVRFPRTGTVQCRPEELSCMTMAARRARE